MIKPLKSAAAGLLGFVWFTPLTASAQIGGSGWTTQSLNFKIQSPTNAPQSARYFVTNNPLPTYHCLTYSNDGAFSIGNSTLPRTEQRFNPDYTNGAIQYQATLMCPSNENSYCVFQIHTGDAQSPTYGSTTFMLFWFTNNCGSVHDYSGTTLATNLGNEWFQLNVDHNLVTHTIRVWVNQKLVWTQQDNGATDFYFKDGVYEQSHGSTLQMDTYITNILEWTSSGTNPPAAPAGLAAAPTLTQIGLSWNASVGATNYNLKRSTANGGPYTTIASLTGTSCTDAGVSNGLTYFYVVTAVDQFGESAKSAPASASLVIAGYQLSTAPSLQSLATGSSTFFTVTMTTNNAFSGSVALFVTGLPGGAGANFSPPSLSAPGTSTLTVNTDSNTTAGNYALTIGGTDGRWVVTTNVTLSLSGIAASPGTLLWTGNGGGTNWSTAFNWTNITAGGYGPPGPANHLIFTNTAANFSGATNNVVDGNFTVTSLQYNNNAVNLSPNYQVTVINSGQILTVTNGLIVGTAVDSGASQVVNAAITGANGTLILSNGILAVTQGSGTDGAHQAVLDLSGLGTFNLINVAKIGVAVDQLPAQAGDGGQRSSGILYLAQTNLLSVTSTGVTNGILIGWNDSQGNGNSDGVPNAADHGSALYLGQTNAIYTDAIYVGTDKTLGCLLAFNPNELNNPTAYFRGLGGSTSRVSLWGIGDTSMKANSNQSASGTNDFTGGTVDALVGNMDIGVSETGNSGGNTGNGTGVLIFNAGTIDVNNLTNGWSAGTGTNGTDNGTGTVNVNGTATLKVNRILALGMSTGTGAGVPSGTLNITDGTVQATNIIGGSGVSTINLNSGMLDLQSGNPAPGKIANVSTLNIGGNAVDDPALLANAAAISVSNAIVIAPNGTLTGNTVITSPGLTVNGAISPGTGGAGWMTNSGPVTLGAGGQYVVTVQDAAARPSLGWGFLQVSQGINLHATNGNPFTIVVQTAIGPAANFNVNTNYDWVIVTASGGITNFNADAFTVNNSLFENNLAGGYFYVRTNNNSLVLSFTNNHPPVAEPVTLYRTGTTMMIPVVTLAPHWGDPDGDPVMLDGVNTSSAAETNNVSTDGTYIYYTNVNHVADAITYMVQDGRTNPPAIYRAGDTLQTTTGQVNILPPPAISNVTRSGGNLAFSGAGGMPDGTFYLLSTTNLAFALNRWTVVATNAFDASGNFNSTNPIDANNAPLFFILKFP